MLFKRWTVDSFQLDIPLLIVPFYEKFHFSTVFIHQARTIDATIGNTAWTDKHAVARAAGEVAAAPDRTVVLAFGTSELQTQPKAGSKVSRAHVTDAGHFIGTVQQDLHALMEADLVVRTVDGSGATSRNAAAAAASTQCAPAVTTGVGTTSLVFVSGFGAP